MSLNCDAKDSINTLSVETKSGQILHVAIIPKQPYTAIKRYWISVEQHHKSRKLDPPSNLARVLTATLSDPLREDIWLTDSAGLQTWCNNWTNLGFQYLAEKQFLPGVTDNSARIVEEALNLLHLSVKLKVASGESYLGKSLDDFANAEYRLFHPLIERLVVHDLKNNAANPSFLSFPTISWTKPAPPLEINLLVSDQELGEISRDRLLALSLDEMRVIRVYFSSKTVQQARKEMELASCPTDVELEILAQTWSEHCKHKIFNATIEHKEKTKDGSVTSTTIKSLYRCKIKDATKQISDKRPDLLSVFVDNSGVVKWDDNFAVCFKVETHNSPCALEPYGGAITGILGVNRDILGTGIGAKPLFNTDVLCFAYPHTGLPKRPKLLPPETIINGVRKGIEDGGNKSGIPTVNGAIVFEDGYRAKPLVFCGTGGILPLSVNGLTGFGKHTQAGDTIVMAGGRVGKDGVHGATFSSEALHEGSPVTAVQIGDPFTQKRLIDFVLEARDSGLITGITDNGAGGLSSSVGEMAELTGGATIELDMVPTKYPGLADWEIVVSESQERMTISTNDFTRLQDLATKHQVEVSAVGEFNTSGKFQVTRAGKVIACLDLQFLHTGVPVLTLQAESIATPVKIKMGSQPEDLNTVLLRLLAHPNICNRETVIRQYDHEVQGRSVIKQLMGARQNAACDAAVITPVLGSQTGLAIANGLCPRLSIHDAKLMAICAADEAIRNLVCVGTDPSTISLLDNFCWPDPIFSETNPDGKKYLGMLVQACQGLYEAVIAFEAPLISGKDSMKNNFDDGVVRLAVPPTLLISGMGKVHDINKCISMEFKEPDHLIYLLSAGALGLAGSHYEQIMEWQSDRLCSLDLDAAKKLYQLLHEAIRQGWVQSAHDLSEGGLAVALAECAIGSGLGANIFLHSLKDAKQPNDKRSDFQLFGEGPGKIVVSINKQVQDKFQAHFSSLATYIGTTTQVPILNVREDGYNQSQDPIIKLSLLDLEYAWNSSLPFAKEKECE
jgi:phosphoribosylformylglycinamidine synthase